MKHVNGSHLEIVGDPVRDTYIPIHFLYHTYKLHHLSITQWRRKLFHSCETKNYLTLQKYLSLSHVFFEDLIFLTDFSKP